MNEQERMQFFYEMFDSSLPRLGPGTDASTLKALNILLCANPRREARDGQNWPRVLDLGCGTGPQALVLARHLDGRILAIDNHQPLLDALRRRAEAEGLSGKIVTRLDDMRTLEFAEGSFDVIWSEGALFIMGFREGLAKCRPWLAENGFLAVTELCWLMPDAPIECRQFLESRYPVTADVHANLCAMRECGYTVVDHFLLPESAWRDEYYAPMEARLQLLRGQYAGDVERLDMIGLIQTEIDNYRKYSAYYGYVFYVLRR
jgi:SAM-dependent methyltransferase